jgi:hypothetical protein
MEKHQQAALISDQKLARFILCKKTSLLSETQQPIPWNLASD